MARVRSLSTSRAEKARSEIIPPAALRVRVVMENVLQHLNTEDLESCLHAFDWWYDFINHEKWLRQDVHPFLWGIPCEEHEEIHRCFRETEKPRNIDTEIRIKVKNYSSRRCVPLLFATPYLVENAEILFPGIQPTVITAEYLRLKRSKMFGSDQSDVVKAVEKKLRTLLVKAMRRYFPFSLQLVFSVADYIIGCDEDLKLAEVLNHPGVVGFIIPQYPGFEIHNFELFDCISSPTVPPDSNIKGLLVFSVSHFTFSEALDFVHDRRMYEIAIGGYLDVENNLPPNGSVVGFCGDNVETASLVISPYDEGAEIKLRLFRETALLENKCFAFAFISWIREENTRFKLVKKFKDLYPDIPLCGVISECVFGADYLPGVSEEIKTSYLDQLLDEHGHEYTFDNRTVFVLVSISP